MNRAAAFLTTLFLIGSDRLAPARKDRGATAVEYGLLVGLIAVVIIVAVTALGGQLNGLSTPSATPCPAAPDPQTLQPVDPLCRRSAPSGCCAGPPSEGSRAAAWPGPGRRRVEFALIVPLLLVLVLGHRRVRPGLPRPDHALGRRPRGRSGDGPAEQHRPPPGPSAKAARSLAGPHRRADHRRAAPVSCPAPAPATDGHRHRHLPDALHHRILRRERHAQRQGESCDATAEPTTTRGAGAVMVALLMVPLLGFAAIAVDVGGLWPSASSCRPAPTPAPSPSPGLRRGSCGTPRRPRRPCVSQRQRRRGCHRGDTGDACNAHGDRDTSALRTTLVRADPRLRPRAVAAPGDGGLGRPGAGPPCCH